MSLRVEMSIITFDHHAVSRNFSAEICVVFESVYFLSKESFFQDVTNTGNGERGTGNGERGTVNGERGTGNREPESGN